MADEVRVAVTCDADLVTARAEGRAMAERLGFPRPVEDGPRYGLTVVAADEGPGIRDVDAALRDDYSGRGGLGLGMPGARRLMDEFDIASGADGTTVTMKKWRFRDELARPREERRR